MNKDTVQCDAESSLMIDMQKKNVLRKRIVEVRIIVI